MIQEIADNKKKLCGTFIPLCIFMLVVIGTPSWSRAVALEKLEPLIFSAADQDKVKVALFYTCLVSSNQTTMGYTDIFEALSAIEPQRYKIIINPFRINTFDKNETFAFDAGRKMKVDVVAFIKISVSAPKAIIAYSLINIRNQKASKGSLDFTIRGGGKGEPLEQPATVAHQLFNEWKEFFSAVAAVDSTPPVIEIISPKMEGGSASPVATMHTEIRGRVRDDHGVKWVTVNDKEVTLAESGEFTYMASLSEGDNPFEVEASDVHGNVARKTVMIRYEVPQLATPSQQRPKPTLYKSVCWVFSIGVSDYENKRLSLKYAHNDAKAIADFFKAQEGKLFSEVIVKTLINEECTRANIMENFASHLGKAASDDVVFIFIAGHGVRHKQTGSYYFLTYNADSGNLIYEALKWSDFEEAIKILSENVNRVILVLDTCHAGEMKAYLRGIEVGEDLPVVLKESSGLYILASSKSGEDSMESEQFTFPVGKGGHGAFTYAILRGLSGEANYDNDSYVSIYELFQYVAKIVPRITEGRQHPYSRIAGTDMPIAVVRSK